MSRYTIDLVFWNPDTCSICVEAPNLAAAIELAYDVAWEGGQGKDYETMRSQETCMDCCTATAIAGIARGRHDTAFDAPAGAQIKVPAEDQDAMWEPGTGDGVEWRRNQIKRLEREITDLIDKRVREAAEPCTFSGCKEGRP